jgi:hypothetical protein
MNAYESRKPAAITSWTRPQLSPHLLDLLGTPSADGEGSAWTPGESGQRIAAVQVSASLLGVTWMGMLAGRDARFDGLRDKVLRLLREKAGGRTVAIKG